MDSEELKWTEPNDEPIVGTLVGAALSQEERDADFEPGAKLGRYVVLAHMGAGAMGVVYAAYDPQLDRRIALKLMHQRGDDPERAERASQRMLAEAKAMAQLNHPNVISVHDAGTIDGRVFIAMEFVEGVPLSRWMREETRAWHQLLEVFIKAGRGLMAAHAAGLVHRDFKPDNVLVGLDGRVRVLDFGLARRFDGSRDVVERRDREAGTPAYMSPEQHLGKILDHRADQFSFCVALYEALYGEMPFAAKSRLELALAVTDGRVGPAPKRASVPNWLRWALLRGLDPDPDGRWEDMGALIQALSRDPRSKLRTIGLWSGVAVALLAAIGTTAYFVTRPDDPPPQQQQQCTGGAELIAEVWNDERRATVRGAFAGRADVPDELGAKIEATFDAWAASWAFMHQASCEATVKGNQSEWMHDRRMLCLDARRLEFGEVVAIMSSDAVASLARVGEAALDLPELRACEAKALDSQEQPPQRDAATKQRIVELERDLYAAHTHEMTGSFDEALPLAESSVERARALGDQALIARALLTQAQIVMAKGGYEAAKALLEEAEFAAERAGADRLRGDVLITLAHLDIRSRDATAALRRVKVGRAVLDRVSASVVEYAVLEGVAAQALLANDQLEEAERRVRAAIASLSELEPPPVELASLHATLGVISRELGRYADARAELERAQLLWVGQYGEQHPRIAEVRFEFAVVDARQGRHEAAVAGYEAALEVFEQVYGESSLEVAQVSAALAICFGELGRHDEALRQHQRARAIFRAQGDDARVDLAKTIDMEGRLRFGQGRHDDALALHQQAFELLERARGSQGFDASELAELAEVRVHLGEALLELDRPQDARAHLDAALALLGAPTSEQAQDRVARVRVLAARAWAAGAGADLGRARTLANSAIADYRTLQRVDSVAEVESWLGSLDSGE